MMRIHGWWTVGVMAMVLTGVLEAAPVPGLELARELTASKEYPQAALEFRRLAMDTNDPEMRGSYYWMAGYAYWKANRLEQAERMLNEAEDATPELETEIYLLRAENSRKQQRLPEAVFYLESLADEDHTEEVRLLATKRLAAVRAIMNEYDGAREALRASPLQPMEKEILAIDNYEKGRDKSLVTGGLLGLIPGLGYAYSGEYANAVRSLILNGLCIWGLVEFSEREQWGGVALVGFAEITFYSGSVYGGADAAARYNENRLRNCTRIIEKNAHFDPVPAALPLLELKFSF